MADGGERALGAFAALPPVLTLAVLALLPVDARLRCREVCRDWCAALDDISLWTRLDMSDGSGVAHAPLERRAAGLLAAAALRAGGQLQFIDVTACDQLDFDALHRVVGGSAATMREMRVAQGACRTTEELAHLLRSAPQLRLLVAAQMHCGNDAGFELLRDEQLFAPLRLHYLEIDATPCAEDAAQPALTLRLVAAAAPTQLYLTGIDLSSAAAIGALVDAALAHRMSDVFLHGCRLTAAAPPALARLLRGGAVTRLLLDGDEDEEDLLADEAGVALFCDALRTNTSLCAVQLSHFHAWVNPAVGTALLGALTGHPSVRELDFGGNGIGVEAEQTAAAAAALVALVAADTLTELDVSWSCLGEAVLGPLFDALPGVTRLLVLDCFCGSHEDDPDLLSDAFIRTRMVPALRANASLRKLQLGLRASTREAQAVVNSPARR